jgi:hypothetical protein
MLKLFLLGFFAIQIFECVISDNTNYMFKLIVLIFALFSRKFRIMCGLILFFNFSVCLLFPFSAKNYLFYNAISSENLF